MRDAPIVSILVLLLCVSGCDKPGSGDTGPILNGVDGAATWQDTSTSDDVTSDSGAKTDAGAKTDSGAKTDAGTESDNGTQGDDGGQPPCEGPGCDYTTDPNVAACSPGVTSPARKDEALKRVNLIRALSGLAPVVYDSAGDAKAQASALMMVANSDLDHSPPTNWVCYSADGADGASASNLHIAWRSNAFQPGSAAEIVDNWMIDDNVPSLGHRRWIIDPFLTSIAYGSVHGPTQVESNWPYAQAASLVVIGNGQADIAGTAPPFVAYPVGDYPAELFQKDWYFSFGAIVDDTNRWANGSVDFDQATVEVVGSNGDLNVTNVIASNATYGLPNHLQWRVQELQNDVTYTVTIDGVTGEGTQPSYTYTFRLQ